MAKANEARLVKMLDGRSVSFGKRMKMVKDIIRDTDTKLPKEVRFDFENGETKILELGRIPAATVSELTAHGAKQKVGDECADLDNVGDYIVAVESMIERLCDGKWNAEREGGFAGSAVLIEAAMEAFGLERDKAKASLKSLTAAERLAFRGLPEIKPIIERLEAAKVTGIDTAALKGKFAKVEESADQS
jgi:hypothetical protein